MGAPPGGAIQAMAAATQSGGNGAVAQTAPGGGWGDWFQRL